MPRLRWWPKINRMLQRCDGTTWHFSVPKLFFKKHFLFFNYFIMFRRSFGNMHLKKTNIYCLVLSTSTPVADIWRSSGQSSARSSFSTSARNIDPLRASTGISSTSGGEDPSGGETALSITVPTCTAPSTTRPPASVPMETSKLSAAVGHVLTALTACRLWPWNGTSTVIEVEKQHSLALASYSQ